MQRIGTTQGCTVVALDCVALRLVESTTGADRQGTDRRITVEYRSVCWSVCIRAVTGPMQTQLRTVAEQHALQLCLLRE
jgi:hypothetical protein